MEQMEKNVQLNNFANAINSGYLKMATRAFLGTKWEERFVVLTNVGLLYFADPHHPPLDLFPVLDCEIVKVPSNEVKGDENTFKLVYLTKHVTFQCSSRAEYENWTKQIKKLQQVTVEVRDRLKQEEVRRMTMLMGQSM
jgi:PH domain